MHTLSSPPIDGFKMRNSTVTIDEEEQVKVTLTRIIYLLEIATLWNIQGASDQILNEAVEHQVVYHSSYNISAI